jgi:YtkA-like
VFVKRNWLIALCLCILVVQGCRRASETPPELKLTQEVSPQPPRVGQVRVTLGLTDSSGKPITRAGLSIEGYMSHPGMKPIAASVVESEPGRYLSVIDLDMAGDWVFIVHIQLPGQVSIDRQFEIKGVLPA